MVKKVEKTYVEDMDRGVYDIKNKFTFRSKTEKGLTEEIVRQISAEKDEPEWMLEYRLKSYRCFMEKPMPRFLTKKKIQNGVQTFLKLTWTKSQLI